MTNTKTPSYRLKQAQETYKKLYKAFLKNDVDEQAYLLGALAYELDIDIVSLREEQSHAKN